MGHGQHPNLKLDMDWNWNNGSKMKSQAQKRNRYKIVSLLTCWGRRAPCAWHTVRGACYSPGRHHRCLHWRIFRRQTSSTDVWGRVECKSSWRRVLLYIPVGMCCVCGEREQSWSLGIILCVTHPQYSESWSYHSLLISTNLTTVIL